MPPSSWAASAGAEVPVPSRVATIWRLPRQADAGVDISIEQIDDQIDEDDHDPGLHDHPLHQREVALKDPLVEQPADAGPGKDHFDDHGRVDHHDKIDAGE